MTPPPEWRARYRTMKHLALAAACGVALASGSDFVPEGLASVRRGAEGLGLTLVVPALVYFHLLVIWHWKARYRGAHSDLWGDVLLLEASGLLKAVYFFRHFLPDMDAAGRYRDAPAPSAPQPAGRPLDAAG